MKLNIGINDKDREEIAAGLSKLLADSYTLYLKTHNYHWNVTGPLFNTLHTMFEEQYTELAAAVDEIAERIRALGIVAPGSYEQFAALTAVEESAGGESAEEMIRQLVIRERHEPLFRLLTKRLTSPPRTCSRNGCKSTRRTPGCYVACWKTNLNRIRNFFKE